ncbi:MAG: hypothetical protein ACYDAO_08175 [Thermoplasmataceae archaeon]
MDFKTIADFQKDNIDCLKGVFKEFNRLDGTGSIWKKDDRNRWNKGKAWNA